MMYFQKFCGGDPLRTPTPSTSSSLCTLPCIVAHIYTSNFKTRSLDTQVPAHHVTGRGQELCLSEYGEMYLTKLVVVCMYLQYQTTPFVTSPHSTDIIRPPVRSNGRTYKMLVMFSFFSTRNLRATSADHRETLPHDRNRCQFYKLTPKIRGALPPLKNWGPKTCKISFVFIQPPTLIANISGMAQAIQNPKTK